MRLSDIHPSIQFAHNYHAHTHTRSVQIEMAKASGGMLMSGDKHTGQSIVWTPHSNSQQWPMAMILNDPMQRLLSQWQTLLTR